MYWCPVGESIAPAQSAKPTRVAAGAEAGGDGEASARASFWRAGRSAAAQHDVEVARLWLKQAADLASDLPVGKAAKELLATLDRNE